MSKVARQMVEAGFGKVAVRDLAAGAVVRLNGADRVVKYVEQARASTKRIVCEDGYRETFGNASKVWAK